MKYLFLFVVIINLFRFGFMQQYSEIISPEKYVYHISYRSRRNSIHNYGLRANSNKSIGYENAVFAHNSRYIMMDWYPFVMDRYEWSCWDEIDWRYERPKENWGLKRAIKKGYDIWRIDTEKLNRPWFVDSVGEREFGGNIIEENKLFILTYGDIPRNRIALCTSGEDEDVLLERESGWINISIPKIVLDEDFTG